MVRIRGEMITIDSRLTGFLCETNSEDHSRFLKTTSPTYGAISRDIKFWNMKHEMASAKCAHLRTNQHECSPCKVMPDPARQSVGGPYAHANKIIYIYM